jgi:hypothetical protein
MSTAFKYRPKFVDIRVNKPEAGSRARTSAKTAQEDARTADGADRPRAPHERACDHIGCPFVGAHRAPKARDREGDYWWFCTAHAADYNRRWNYFEGMSEAEYADFARGAEYGHRPTWSFQASKLDREAAVYRKFQAFRGERGPGGQGETLEPRRPRVSRLAGMALEALGLKEDAAPAVIRAKYAELVKRYHPDSNGGDRNFEALLGKVVRAYQTLKAAGLT